MHSVLYDSDEWCGWQRIGDMVLHIELRRWADCLLVAPASANFLAEAGQCLCSDHHYKITAILCCVNCMYVYLLNMYYIIAGGISNSLGLCVVRAWDYSKPCLLCPAMNTFMWTNKATLSLLETLRYRLYYAFSFPFILHLIQR